MLCFPIPDDEPVCLNCNDEGCEYCAPADEWFYGGLESWIDSTEEIPF